MAPTKSKLQESILETVQGQNGKPELVDSTPFDQASELSGSQLNESIDPAPVAKTKRKQKSGGNWLSIIAIITAMGSIGFSVYSTESGRQKLQELTESLLNVDEQVAASISQLGQLSDKVQSVQNELSIEKVSLDKLERSLPNLAELGVELQSLKSGIERLGETDNRHQASITSNESKLNRLDERFQKLSSRARVKPIQKKQVTVVKPAWGENTIEGSILSALDTWGIESYAMLLEPNGNWVPLKKGDFYKGWKFSHVDNQSAIFKSGKKQRSLKVEG